MQGITRDQLSQDIAMLTTFASQQYFTDPGFSRSRSGLKYYSMGGRQPAVRVPLERGSVRFFDDPYTKSWPQRSIGLLDAFATIFAGSGGCYACGCVINDKSQELKLIIGSNNDIEKHKRRFIEDLWRLLQQVPIVLGSINREPPMTQLRESPLPAEVEAVDVYLELEEKILAHACSAWDQKLVKAVRKYKFILEKLDRYVSKDIREKSGAAAFVDSLNFLSEVLTLAKEKCFKKTTEYSSVLVAQLLELREKSREVKMELLEETLFSCQNSTDARDLYRISNPFSKLCVLPDALFKIIRLARSPNARRVWSYKFDAVHLPAINADPLPKAIGDWEERFATMGIRGSLPDDNEFDKRLLKTVLKAALEPESPVKIHAEVEVLGYMEKEGLTKVMINSIGVSKLCCPGCCALLGANENPRILVHGRH